MESKIREIRKDKGMKQKELADLIGVSSGTMSAIETLQKIPERRELKKIATALGVTVNEITEGGREKMLPTKVDTLTAEILMLKQQTAQNIIEIGRRLIQVKETLPHGEWLPWLQNKVDFADRTARLFMQASREFENRQSFADLEPSKVFALLALPADQREEFIQNNPVDEMTTRELQAAIKAQKEAESRAAAAESMAASMTSELEKQRNY